MTDVILGILWFFTAGSWLLSAIVFYFSFSGMRSMVLMGSNYGLFGAFQGIAFGIMLIAIGTIFGGLAALISEVRNTRQVLQKEE